MVTVPSDICAVLHRMARHSTAQHSTDTPFIVCIFISRLQISLSLSIYIILSISLSTKTLTNCICTNYLHITISLKNPNLSHTPNTHYIDLESLLYKYLYTYIDTYIQVFLLYILVVKKLQQWGYQRFTGGSRIDTLNRS